MLSNLFGHLFSRLTLSWFFLETLYHGLLKGLPQRTGICVWEIPFHGPLTSFILRFAYHSLLSMLVAVSADLARAFKNPSCLLLRLPFNYNCFSHISSLLLVIPNLPENEMLNYIFKEVRKIHTKSVQHIGNYHLKLLILYSWSQLPNWKIVTIYYSWA